MNRVLHVLGGLKKGGIETFIINVYKNIDKSKVQFDFLICDQSETDYSEYIRRSGGNIYYYTPRKKSVIGNFISLYGFFKKESYRYHSVHLHASSLTNIWALVFAKKYKIKKRIIHSHNVHQGGSIIHKYVHSFNKMIVVYFANSFFSCSLDAANWMFPKSIVENKLFTVIPNAISIEDFYYSIEKRMTIRERLGLSEDDIVVGNIARFHPQKNHTFLLDVFYELHKTNPNYKLILVGQGSLYEEIRKKVELLKIAEYVLFYGESGDIPSLLSGFDLFLFPSLYEGLGIVLIEAQASNLPCVVSDDVIPFESQVSLNYYRISLEESAETWANRIIDIDLSKQNRVCSVGERINKYNIRFVSAKLMDFYLSDL